MAYRKATAAVIQLILNPQFQQRFLSQEPYVQNITDGQLSGKMKVTTVLIKIYRVGKVVKFHLVRNSSSQFCAQGP